MSYEFGWFPRPKYRDLVFYVKADQGMNTRLFDMPDAEDGRALMKALADPAADIAILRAEVERLREAGQLALKRLCDGCYWETKSCIADPVGGCEAVRALKAALANSPESPDSSRAALRERADEAERRLAEAQNAYRRGCPECEDGLFDSVGGDRGFCESCGGVADLPAIAGEGE